MPFTFTELSALLLHMDAYAAQKFWNSMYEVRLSSPSQAPHAIMPNTFSDIGLIDYINFKTFTTGRTGIEKLYRYSHSNGFAVERIEYHDPLVLLRRALSQLHDRSERKENPR
jgi:hypothetical protein